ncbi:MAG: hypothetical protein R2867_24310 [Caldilineaceae bacterium]
MQKRNSEAIEPLEDATTYFTEGPIHEAAISLCPLAAALHTTDEIAALRYLQDGLAIIGEMENHHALLATMRIIRPYLQRKKCIALDPLVGQLLVEIEQFEQLMPKPAANCAAASPVLHVVDESSAIPHYNVGQIEVTVEGKSLTTSDWQTVIRATSLCLLAHPEGLQKEQIGLFFWPDACHRNSGRALKMQSTDCATRCARMW